VINRWTDAEIFLAFALMPDCLTHGCVWDLGGEELGSQDSTGVEGIRHYLHLLVVPRILGFGTCFGIKISRGTEPYQGRWLDMQKWDIEKLCSQMMITVCLPKNVFVYYQGIWYD
jgi:hypothetical protein